MKKIFALAMVMVSLFSFSALAENEPPFVVMEGVVVELMESGDILINTQSHGEVIVHQDAAEGTVFKGFDELFVGQYLYITFSGVMTMSLPGQIFADVIESTVILGEVVSAAGNCLELKGEEQSYIVVLSDEIDAVFQIGEMLTVTAMTTEKTFAGLPVVNTGFVETVPPDNARN